MILKLLRQIASLFMAILLLVSATGFSVHAHSCAGELQDVSFYTKAKSCLMEVQAKPSCHSVEHEAAVQAQACCENHAYQLEQHEETVERSSAKIFKAELKLVALVYTFVLPLFQVDTAEKLISDVYQHPPLARDIPVFVQSFLL